MKPRIYIRHGIWCCSSWENGGRSLKLGHGYSPKQAYDDWAAPVTRTHEAV